MGLVIVCEYGRAKIPFFVEQAGLNLYSLEELAYFLYHNICLADRRLFEDGQLCRWISEEIGHTELAKKLQREINSDADFHDLLLAAAGAAGMFSQQELSKLSERLKRLASLQEQERLKLQADELLDNRNEWAAARGYQHVLRMHQNSRLGKEFYSAVWNNLGVSYARQFLFREALECFEASLKLQEDETVRRQEELARNLAEGGFSELPEKSGEYPEPQKTLMLWEQEYRIRQKF